MFECKTRYDLLHKMKNQRQSLLFYEYTQNLIAQTNYALRRFSREESSAYIAKYSLSWLCMQLGLLHFPNHVSGMWFL